VTDPLTGPGLVPHPEDADHQGCTACDPPAAVSLLDHNPKLSTVSVQAREEDFRIVQLRGQLFVCTRQNGSCCCGWEEKGRLAFDAAHLWAEEWERRKIRNRLHLTFTGCLGPCAAGNNALLQIHGRSIWLKDLNDPTLVPLVFEYVQAMLNVGAVLVPPEGGDGDDLGCLDPVCLMDVDPATARHTTEYGGRTIAFCAPASKKLFLADPAAYLVV
jgi:YHS domain-containing protein